MALTFPKTEIGVINLALHYMSQTKGETVSDTHMAVRACSFVLPQSRDMLLQVYSWEWASEFVALGALTNDMASRWGYKYSRPAGCMKVREISDYGGPKRNSGHDSIRHEATGNAIYCDLYEAYCWYVKEQGEVGVWPNYFIEAVAADVAMRCIASITKRPALALEQAKQSKQIIGMAVGVDANESNNPPDFVPEFILARE